MSATDDFVAIDAIEADSRTAAWLQQLALYVYPQANIRAFPLGQLLGEGSFAKVFRTMRDGRFRAMKAISLPVEYRVGRPGGEDLIRGPMPASRSRNILNELEVLQRFHVQPNDYVIQFFGLWREPSFDTLYIELECALLTFGEGMKYNELNVAASLQWLLQACRGITACHDAGYIHGDIKPENLLLVQSGHSGYVCKVSDFGLAVHEVAQGDFRAAGGTPEYMAPETWASRLPGAQPAWLSKAIDVWAVGLIINQMLNSNWDVPTHFVTDRRWVQATERGYELRKRSSWRGDDIVVTATKAECPGGPRAAEDILTTRAYLALIRSFYRENSPHINPARLRPRLNLLPADDSGGVTVMVLLQGTMRWDADGRLSMQQVCMVLEEILDQLQTEE